MKPFLLLFICMSISACSVKKVDNGYSDVDFIIEKIINTYDLKVRKNDLSNDKISSTLKKTEFNFNEVDINDFENLFVPLGPDGRPDSNAEKFIFKHDYEDFISQFNTKTSEISEIIKKSYQNATASKILRDKKNHISVGYLEFSRVFFSHDYQTAYVEVHYYSGVSGDGTAYILKKNNGTWEIIKTLNLRMS